MFAAVIPAVFRSLVVIAAFVGMAVAAYYNLDSAMSYACGVGAGLFVALTILET